MHSGITLSPLIGQVAAMEILDGVAVDLLKPFRPARFA
jgi:glycine/D-amino acid oxidase-like deaminating enzyme